jgi:tetratricopeptide (TPR) repeat protein
LNHLGLLKHRLGQYEFAAQHYHEALVLFHQTRDRGGEASVLNGLGEVAHALAHDTAAITYHVAAQSAARETGAMHQEARANAGLVDAHDALGETGPARRHYELAVALYSKLAVLQGEHVRARLRRLY